MNKELLTIAACTVPVVATGSSAPAPAPDAAKIPADYHEIATLPFGKRSRGIHPSPDRKTVYVALSGSPIAAQGESMPPTRKISI
jgi:hypothetical protein